MTFLVERLERVLEALSDLTPIEEFYKIVAGMASAG